MCVTLFDGGDICLGAGKPGATTSYTESNSVEPVEPRRVLYSYYTAGSGGVGPTILETSLLLAGEPVVVYANGEKVSTSHPANKSTLQQSHSRSLKAAIKRSASAISHIIIKGCRDCMTGWLACLCAWLMRGEASLL